MSLLTGCDTGSNNLYHELQAQKKFEPTTDVPKLNFPVICNVEVRMDEFGRMNLNDIHKASGEGVHKAPNRWTRLQSTQELVEAYQTPNMTSALQVNNGGASETRGAWAIEELATEYMGWLSLQFKVQCQAVLKAYNHGKINQAEPTPENLLALAQQSGDMVATAYYQGKVTEKELAKTNQRVNALEQRAMFEDDVPTHLSRSSVIGSKLGAYITDDVIKATLLKLFNSGNDSLEADEYKVGNQFNVAYTWHFNEKVAVALLEHIIGDAEHVAGNYYRHPDVPRNKFMIKW